jgi:hypothetical protein
MSKPKARNALVFAGKVLVVIAVVIAALVLVRVAFGLSTWAGLTVVSVYVVALYTSADRWVAWLPGLLVFSVLNSVIALVTGHSPTNSQTSVSTSMALLLLAFYATGFIVSCRYDATRLSALDRCAWLTYVACMIIPAFTSGGSLGNVTSAIAASAMTGIVVIVAALAVHRKRALGVREARSST